MSGAWWRSIAWKPHPRAARTTAIRAVLSWISRGFMLNGYYTIFSATAFCARYCRRIVASPGFIVTRSRPPTAWTVRSPDESTTFADFHGRATSSVSGWS